MNGKGDKDIKAVEMAKVGGDRFRKPVEYWAAWRCSKCGCNVSTFSGTPIEKMMCPRCGGK